MSALRVLGRVTGWTCTRSAARATLGRPHRFHDVLLAVGLAAPVVVEALARRDRAAH